MAGRDFARIEARRDEAPHRGVARLLVVAGLAAALAAGYWLGGSRAGPETDADLARLQARLTELKAVIEARDAEIERLKKEIARLSSPSARLGDLTFYHELPAEPVIPAPLPEETAAPPVSPAGPPDVPENAHLAKGADLLAGIIRRERMRRPEEPGGSVSWVQAASFRARSDAEKLCDRLAGKGFRARIRLVRASFGERWHRVMLGPWSSAGEARQMIARLRREMNLDGLIVKGGADGD
ncbi:MAG: SPOR domain-containing protein [Mariprofundaceae bacterium]